MTQVDRLRPTKKEGCCYKYWKLKDWQVYLVYEAVRQSRRRRIQRWLNRHFIGGKPQPVLWRYRGCMHYGDAVIRDWYYQQDGKKNIWRVTLQGIGPLVRCTR